MYRLGEPSGNYVIGVFEPYVIIIIHYRSSDVLLTGVFADNVPASDVAGRAPAL